MDSLLNEHAHSGLPILTVNNRLARLLTDQYDQCQCDAGLTAWQRPVILSLSAWADTQLGTLMDVDTRLNRAQCLNVWESIIEADQGADRSSLLQIPQTAKRVHQAHQLLVRYGTNFSSDAAAPDHQAFLHWRARWHELARQHGWRDPAETCDMVVAALTAGRLDLPQAIILAGFDELTPDVDRLCSAIRGCGCAVNLWTPPPREDVGIHRFDDAPNPSEEVRSCARWVRHLLDVQPHVSIGIVVPQLEAYRSLFDTVFQAELEPEATVDGHEAPLAYNISLPRRLDREGPVRAALSLLKLGRQIEQEALSWLIRSPYIGTSEAERAHRGRLDRRMREDGRPLWSLGQAKTFAERFAIRSGLKRCGISRLLAACEQGQRTAAKRRPGDWAEAFLLLLQNASWPGARTLSSREFQVVEAFQAVFVDMAKLDRVSGPISRKMALAILQRLAGDSPFQPESPASAVQVLGLLEAGGLSFDYLWVPGLHDGAFPQPPDPNPFIPLDVQRRCQMQRADADRERLFAHQVAERLFRSASQVVLSWPQQRDGLEQRPSPLITAYPAAIPDMSAPASPHRQMMTSRKALETLLDDRAPALNSKKRFSGGTGILKDQALCPFRAFAHFRLRARELSTAEIGFDGLERGSLAHHSLEFFWKDVQDQAGLMTLTPEELKLRINCAVDKALDRFEKEKRRDVPPLQKALESSRLFGLLQRWLALEAKRPPFRVDVVELNHTIEVGGLLISTRIDRIDELGDGRGMAIIDYKTGQPDPAQWFEERITEPQLPLYCLSLPQKQVGAVLFAQVRSKPSENTFRGILRDEEGSWSGLRCYSLDRLSQEKGLSTFDAVLEYWQTTLAKLGNAFVDGDARVDPVDRDLACKYCDLSSLCRIYEDNNAPLVLREGIHD